MFTSFKNRTQSMTKGFTLIELLVVIAIIGILSSVVLASLGTARQKARDATRISDMKNIQLALNLYFDTIQAYPSNRTAAGANLIQASGALPTGLITTLVGPTLYIPALPQDPLSGSRAATEEYLYQGMTAAAADCPGTGTVANCARYQLAATFERDDNGILASDSDLVVAAGIQGNGDVNCSTAVAAAPDQCYAIAE